MIPIRVVPLEKWPGEPTRRREVSPFSSPLAKTLELLDRELSQLVAKNAVLQAFVQPCHIRNDGWLNGSATLWDPGLILSFESRKNALSFPCDRFQRWQDNLRAIALALEALRKIDRYGITKRAEQYQGWKRIEAPTAISPFKTPEEAARFLSVKAYGDDRPALFLPLVSDREQRQLAYRKAAAILHPDQPGGHHEEFVMLRQAMDLLESR